MTTDRVYKPGMPESAAIVELRRHSGSQFSPTVVTAFIAVRDATEGQRAAAAATPTARAASAARA